MFTSKVCDHTRKGPWGTRGRRPTIQDSQRTGLHPPGGDHAFHHSEAQALRKATRPEGPQGPSSVHSRGGGGSPLVRHRWCGHQSPAHCPPAGSWPCPRPPPQSPVRFRKWSHRREGEGVEWGASPLPSQQPARASSTSCRALPVPHSATAQHAQGSGVLRGTHPLPSGSEAGSPQPGPPRVARGAPPALCTATHTDMMALP